MKIGIVCQNFPPSTFEGGISHYSKLLADNLSALGHQIYALTSTEFTSPVRQPNSSLDVRIITIKGPWNHKSAKIIRKIVTENRLDAVILQYSPASFKTSFRIAWALMHFPYQKITAFHTLWGGGLDRLLGILMLFGNSKIIATNSEIMNLLERHLSFFLKKTYWIPIGSNILPIEQDTSIPDSNKPLICYFGMLYPGKGLDLILDTLTELKKRGRRFHFKFLGGGMLDHERYESDFRKQIEARGISENVEHTGLIPAEDISLYLTKSRILFLPYESGLSDRRGSFMAAIAHGKAVLTTPPIVDMPFLKNGVNVMWPSIFSLQGYADAMEKLLDDDMLIATLQEGARKLSRHFRWDKIAAEHDLAIRQG